MAEWTGRRQNARGLWPCFFDEPGVLPDTSGSAGIAAAVALEVQRRIIDSRLRNVAELAFEELSATYLEPDGWLRGARKATRPRLWSLIRSEAISGSSRRGEWDCSPSSPQR